MYTVHYDGVHLSRATAHFGSTKYWAPLSTPPGRAYTVLGYTLYSSWECHILGYTLYSSWECHILGYILYSSWECHHTVYILI